MGIKSSDLDAPAYSLAARPLEFFVSWKRAEHMWVIF